MPRQPSYTMLFCGEVRWCCCFDNLGKTCDKTECCSRNFTLAQGLGTVVRQFDNAMLTPSAADGNNDMDCHSRGGGDCGGWDGRDRTMRMIPFVVAGVLGSLLLATIVAFGFSCTQNRRLQRQVDTLQNINANLKLSSFNSSVNTSARPSVHSIQPLVAFNNPSYQQEDPTTPSPDSYHPGSRTMANSLYNGHRRQPLGAAGLSPHEQPPITPLSSGPPPPGYGFPPTHPPIPPQLSGRRPSLPELQYSIPPPTPQQPRHVQVISELPAEKDQR